MSGNKIPDKTAESFHQGNANSESSLGAMEKTTQRGELKETEVCSGSISRKRRRSDCEGVDEDFSSPPSRTSAPRQKVGSTLNHDQSTRPFQQFPGCNNIQHTTSAEETLPPAAPPPTPNEINSDSSSQQKLSYDSTTNSTLATFVNSVDMRNNGDGNCSTLSSAESSPSHAAISGQSQGQTISQDQRYAKFACDQGQATPRGSSSVASFCSVASSTSSASMAVPPAPPSTPVTCLMSEEALLTQNGEAYGSAGRPPMHSMATPKAEYSVEYEGKTSTGPLPTDSGTSSSDPRTSATSTSGTSQQEANAKDGFCDDFRDWKVGSRYELIRILGKGSYGEVAQARDLQAQTTDAGDNGPKFVAIKRITSAFEQEVDALRLFREIHILRRLRGHECIIQLVDIVPPESDNIDEFEDLYLVFEYVDTDLYKLIMSPQYLTTEHIQTFLYQMLTGLKFMHSSSVIHRDLKPANILLNEDCSLKICDFGLARIVDSEAVAKSSDGSSDSSNNSRTIGKPAPGLTLTRQLTKHVVTRWYRAPELILIQPYTSAVDIWSLGCILGELLSMQEGSVPGYQDRVPLFPGGSCYPLSGEGESIKKNERLDQLSVILGVIGTPSPQDVESIGNANDYIKTLKKQPSKSLDSLYPAADKAAIDLLKSMLQFNPKKRCTAEEALNHEFMKGVRRKEMERNADQPLIGPMFLNSNKISLEELKRKTFEEVMLYKNKQNLN